MNTQNTTPFTAVDQNRVPLDRLDVRTGEAAEKLARVLPTGLEGRRVSTFNSAL
ncbi:hypothetical protein [Streptomyces yaizuensis]|uniref:FXSXX-COOH protein n=1 Tax=Streptomyces yaizuensis TaxID=2989713 RepID=A0ABQ5P0N3_9ACTN|nr:hypothetical protein [Streptomyces sp. YSPA8]GLF96166.1 FXSXX-COOH protein [Streptomyces sp. YSPA8]